MKPPRRLSLTLTVVCSLCVISGVLAVPVSYDAKAQYLKQRQSLIQEEEVMRTGGKMVLSPSEQIINEAVMKEKRHTFDSSRLNRTTFVEGTSFFKSKPAIDQTAIFKLIKRMPKGAALHLHELAVGQGQWVVKNATYRPNAHMCVKDGLIKLGMFTKPPSNADCMWRPVSSVRAASGDPMAFDEMLIQNLTLLATDPAVDFPTVTPAWDRFNAYFQQVLGLLYNADVMRDYLYQALQDFYDDNVQYIELRFVPGSIFELDQPPEGAEADVNLYKEVADSFTKDHPDFSGMKIIMTGLRNLPVDVILGQIKETIKLREKYPDFLLGYDLVGQEDPYYSLEYYLDALLYPSQQDPPIHLPYFFHAAETNWQGTEVDYNLVDALLLNTTRIGHGYGLIKHPKLAEMVKARGIAVEINPISNQVLGLVKDLRNHGLIPLLADDFPVVISSDDPGAWSSSPLSHDFYLAFLDMCGRDGDLTILKQLAKNSITYSMMSAPEKQAALNLWQRKWDNFVQETVQEIMKGTISSTVPSPTTVHSSDNGKQNSHYHPFVHLLG